MRHTTVAIVVTYNRKTMLRECIHALLNQTYKDLDVLIVDNHSTDGTSQVVKSFNDPRIYYANTNKNLGGAGGFQFGIKTAMLYHYKFLWLMDDDSIPTSTALNNLINIVKNKKKFGFLSSKVLWKDHSMCKMNIPKKTLNHKLSNFVGTPKQIIMATFVSFFVPAKVVTEIGLPIKEFFIWADDLEYSRRISRLYPCYFVPDSIVIHKCHSNNGSNIVTDSNDRLNRYRYAYRNEVYVYRREGAAGWIHLALKTILHLARVTFKAKSQKKERLQIILSSTRSGLHFHPQIEYVKNNKE